MFARLYGFSESFFNEGVVNQYQLISFEILHHVTFNKTSFE